MYRAVLISVTCLLVCIQLVVSPIHAIEIQSITDLTVLGYFQVTGSGFGEEPGDISFSGRNAPIANWTDSEIVAYVPIGVGVGTAELVIDSNTGNSDSTIVDISKRSQQHERFFWSQRIDSAYAFARPVKGPNGNVYVLDLSHRIYSITPFGGVEWIVDGSIGGNVGPNQPIFGNTSLDVGPDGTIYCAHESYVTALNSDGSLKWRFDIDANEQSFIVFDTKYGPDNNIYVASTHDINGGFGVYSLTAAGSFRWNVPHPYDHGTTRRQIELVFGPGSEGLQLYFAANQNSYSITLDDGQIVFNNLPQVTGFAAVSPVDGTVHSANYAYDPDGNINWQSPVFLNGFPALDSSGTHFCTTSLGGSSVVALDSAGQLLYDNDLDLTNTSPEMATVTPDDHRLLIHDIFNKMLVLDPQNGNEVWRIELSFIENRPQYWLRRPVFDVDSSVAYYASALNTSGSAVRDRMFLHAVAISNAAPVLGDLNSDGTVNLLDVQPFVDSLSSGEYQWEADANSDGIVNLLDVQPFVELLSN